MAKKGWVVFLVSLLLVIYGVYSSQKTAEEEKAGLILYYGDTCSYCREVEDFINQHQLKDKLALREKEVYRNQANSLALAAAAKSCGLPTDNIAVPFLTADGRCFVGATEVEEFLRQKANLP